MADGASVTSFIGLWTILFIYFFFEKPNLTLHDIDIMLLRKENKLEFFKKLGQELDRLIAERAVFYFLLVSVWPPHMNSGKVHCML